MRRLSGDEGLVRALRSDYRTASVDARTKAALDFAVKLTKTPADMTREDMETLRAAGFDDRGIVGVTHVACHFNYMNRVAQGLGCDLGG